MFNLFKKKSSVHQMPIDQALETAALLGKHLRTYTPVLAAIGSSTSKEAKQILVEQFSEALTNDVYARQDILKILNNLLGREIKSLAELKTLDKQIAVAWKANSMDVVLVACLKLGIYEQEDLVNLTWVLDNWIKNAGNN